jgi:hypothetical protein
VCRIYKIEEFEKFQLCVHILLPVASAYPLVGQHRPLGNSLCGPFQFVEFLILRIPRKFFKERETLTSFPRGFSPYRGEHGKEETNTFFVKMSVSKFCTSSFF